MRLTLPKTTLYSLGSLESYWTFDSDFTDQVGSNDLTASNVTSTASSKTEFSNSATFNQGYAKNESMSSVPSGDNDITINFWLNTLSLVEQDVLLYEGASGLFDEGLSIKTKFGDIICVYDLSEVTFGHPADLSTSPDWHMITLVYDASASTLYLYLDGVQVHSGAIADRDFTQKLWIGSFYIGDMTPVISGYMDELSIFSDALSAEQVMQLYLHPGLGGFIPDEDTVAYWRFENDYLDDSGKLHHLHEGDGVLNPSSLVAGHTGAKAVSIDSGGWLYADTSADIAGDLDLFGNPDLSIVMWIYYTGYHNNVSAGLISRITDNPTELGWAFLAVDFLGTIRLRLILASGPGTAFAIPGTGAIPTNEWCQVALTRSNSGQDIKFYINGKLDKTDSNILNAGAFLCAENLQVGFNKYNTGYFEGYMDDILLFNDRALTQKEIQKLYTLQLGRFKCS